MKAGPGYYTQTYQLKEIDLTVYLMLQRGKCMKLTDSRTAGENLIRNLDFIKNENHIASDRELAARLGISSSSLATIRKERKVPPIFPFFENLLQLTSFSIEEILSEDLARKAEEMKYSALLYDDTEWSRYLGLYCMYYYKTAAFKGRENKADRESLEYGLMAVYREKEGPFYTYKCRADFGLHLDEMKERYEMCHEDFNEARRLRRDFQSVLLNHFQDDRFYDGTIAMTNSNLFITADSGSRDRITMVFHRPDMRSLQYIGGLCTSVSVSKGRASCPCMQIIGLSRYPITVAEEEIARRLLLGFPQIYPPSALEDLTRSLQGLAASRNSEEKKEEGVFDLSEQNRRYILDGHISSIITGTVEHNLFRVVKISSRDDDDWYHFVKEFRPEGGE